MDKRKREGDEGNTREAKRQKERSKYQEKIYPCEKCGSKERLSLISPACDGNHFTLPNGRSGRGYLEDIPAVCSSDGVGIDLCVQCGWIRGFNSALVTAAVSKWEDDQEEDKEDDEDEEEEEEDDDEEEEEEETD